MLIWGDMSEPGDEFGGRCSAHVVEELRELAQSPLDPFDVFMTFLHLSVGRARLAIAVGGLELRMRNCLISFSTSLKPHKLTAWAKICPPWSSFTTALTSSGVASGLTATDGDLGNCRSSENKNTHQS
jgi:hypothetical protein